MITNLWFDSEEAVPEGGNARTAARPARRLPSHIFSHAPAALTARGAPVQIWQPWEVSHLSSLAEHTHVMEPSMNMPM